MDIKTKLKILADSAKYDVSCSSSGSNRKNNDGIGDAKISGLCHSFSADGRCISLLKILMTNVCIYDCKYCVNRSSNSVERACFTEEEIAQITINFYKRNYIEGLFLSSGIIKNANYTMNRMYGAIKLLREKYKFNGYIHVKTIPGADKEIIDKMGLIVDRMSINIELPSNESLKLLAPDKEKNKIIEPMKYISDKSKTKKNFIRAGQTTQMIIGATPDTDYKILSLSESLYSKLNLKRVYYSAYVPLNNDKLLPSLDKPPLLRENRLYQADWLLRFYNFKVDDLLDQNSQNFNTLLDPKADWALRNLDKFPVEINTVDFNMLIRVPGIGLKSANKIVSTRRYTKLKFEDLKKMKISIKRAKYFITCGGQYFTNSRIFKENIIKNSLIYEERNIQSENNYLQLSLFNPTREDKLKCLTGEL